MGIYLLGKGEEVTSTNIKNLKESGFLIHLMETFWIFSVSHSPFIPYVLSHQLCPTLWDPMDRIACLLASLGPWDSP